MNKAFLVLALILLTAITCYINTLSNEFVYDDIPAITENKIVTGEKSWTAVWKSDFWGNPLKEKRLNSYRPLSVLSFKLNSMMGAMNPLSFHLLNIFFHLISILLLFYVSYNILLPKNILFASMLSLFFAVHAIHTESVTSIVGRADVLACVFFLSSFIFYEKSSSSGRYSYLFLCIFFAFLSMLAKEIGITVLGLCFFYDLWIKNEAFAKKVLSLFLTVFSKRKWHGLELATSETKNHL